MTFNGHLNTDWQKAEIQATYNVRGSYQNFEREKSKFLKVWECKLHFSPFFYCLKEKYWVRLNNTKNAELVGLSDIYYNSKFGRNDYFKNELKLEGLK